MQKSFKDVIDLIQNLNRDRSLISRLYQNRKAEFTYEEARDLVDAEGRIEFLEKYGVIRIDNNIVELEDTFLHFLEEVLRANETISNATVAETIANLRNDIRYLVEVRDDRNARRPYIYNIRRALRNIAQTTRHNYADLRRNIDLTYKTERNYRIKRSKIEHYRTQLNDIGSLIKETELLLAQRTDELFNIVPDDSLKRIIVELQTSLNEVARSSVALHRTIRNYLNQIEEAGRLINKIQRLKYLRDQLTWERDTDVCSILNQRFDLPLEEQTNIYTKPSLTFLSNTDEGLDILHSLGTQMQRDSQSRRRPEPIGDDLLLQQQIVQHFIDINALANAFFATRNDLFSFVLSYNYPYGQTLAQRVSYYVRIAQNYSSKLIFTGRTAHYGNIEYSIILARTQA